MKLSRRTILTGSTFLTLCGVYEAYALCVSPLFAPPADFSWETGPPDKDPPPPKPPENRRQAELYLSDLKWKAKDDPTGRTVGPADSKFQFRTDSGFFYFMDWNTVEPTGQIRFEPFAMIWRPKGHPPDKAPYTIVSDSALVEFAQKFDMGNPNPGRVVGGALEGKVRIRGPDNLKLDGKHFNFAESALKIWSDHVVEFQQGPHKGRGLGVELDLIPSPDSKDQDKPAVSGIRSVRLRKDVKMRLVSEPKPAEKPAGDSSSQAEGEIVFVSSDGSFQFDVEADLATFENKVRVERPTGNNQSDRLTCHLLTLFFERKGATVAASPASSSAPAGQNSEPTPHAEGGANFGNLEFRRLRAEGQEGQVVTVASQRSDMRGQMNELTYDAKDRVVVLRDAKQVTLFQKNNELHCGEITAGLDDKNQIERATCRGAGQLLQFAREADPQRGRDGRPAEVSAKWQKKLNKSFDAATGLDLIEFEGRAELSQVGKSSLKAEIIRIWVTPADQKFDKPAGDPATAESRVQPKKLLAVHDVEFDSPQIRGQTETLQIWFEEGGLPAPPRIQAARRVSRSEPRPQTKPNPQGAAAENEHALRQEPMPIARGQAFAAVGDAPPKRAPGNGRRAASPPVISPSGKPGVKSRGKPGERTAAKPETISAGKRVVQPDARPIGSSPEDSPPVNAAAENPPAENPLVVKSDLIRVQVMRDGDDSKISEVSTEGHVHVTQEHAPGELPLDLTGDRLELKNYAGSTENQIVDILGRPARVQDRKLQLEGPKIHFDRISNNASVIGAGVLRVPVPNGIDGKALAVPQMLDVFWKESMDFDGDVARFFAGVRSKLENTTMTCDKMQVTFSRRISFAQDASGRDSPGQDVSGGQAAEIRSIVCRDNVDIQSQEYENNRLIGRRSARAFEFTFDNSNGRLTSQGPGTLLFWRRGNGNSAKLKPGASAISNRALAAEPVEWEYTRIDFQGQMDGNTNARATTFRDRVHVVYGPVSTATEAIDEETMPKDGGWMNCNELNLTQQPATKTAAAYITMRAIGNTELDGRSFHAMAHMATYDESKGLYILTGDGKRDATIWRETAQGAEPAPVSAQGMEFTPATKVFKITHASYGQGSR